MQDDGGLAGEPGVQGDGVQRRVLVLAECEVAVADAAAAVHVE